VISTYCHRDVEILKEMFCRWLEFLYAHDLGNFRFTLAGQAFTAFRHRFMKHDIYIHDNKQILQLERDAYRGGRTEAFRLGRLPGVIYYLDVNSLYPYVMRNFEYPVRLIRWGDKLTKNQLKYYLQSYCVIAHVKIRTEEPAFGMRMERLVFPTGTFCVTLCTEELKYAFEHDMIEEIYQYAVYQKANIFQEYVDFFYSLKEQYTREQNPVFRSISKLFLNSLYGKFGQKQENIEFLTDVDDDSVEVSDYINADTGEQGQIIQFANRMYFRKKGEDEAFDSFPAIAAEVTANARMHLWRLMQKAGRENVYYC